MANSDPMGLQSAYGLKAMDEGVEQLVARRVRDMLLRRQQEQQELTNRRNAQADTRADRALNIQQGYLDNTLTSSAHERATGEQERTDSAAKIKALTEFLGTLPEHVRPAATARGLFNIPIDPDDFQVPETPDQKRAKDFDYFARQQRLIAGLRPIGPEPLQKVDDVDEDGTPVTRFLPRSSVAGQSFRKPPTAQQRNTSGSLDAVENVVDQLDELSQQINTEQGIMATAAGTVRGAKAKLNYDRAVALYNAVLQSNATMLARARGEVGVVTDQDAMRALSAFPKPTTGRDVAVGLFDLYRQQMRAHQGSLRGTGSRGQGAGSNRGGEQQDAPALDMRPENIWTPESGKPRKVGNVRVFPNGTIGRWNGTAWEKAGGQ